MSVLYHPSKDNVVADAISRITMGSVLHINEAKKDLVKDFHRLASLGLRLEGFPNCGVMVHHNSESSLVVELKYKQHLDHQLIEYKESVLDKFNYSFSLGEMVFFDAKGDYVFRCRWVEGTYSLGRPWVPLLHSSRFKKMYHDLMTIHWLKY